MRILTPPESGQYRRHRVGSIANLDEFETASTEALEICRRIVADNDLQGLANRLLAQDESSKQLDDLLREKKLLSELSVVSTEQSVFNSH